MVGHPKHVAKALEAGVDIIGAQASEGGVRFCLFSALFPYLSGFYRVIQVIQQHRY